MGTAMISRYMPDAASAAEAFSSAHRADRDEFGYNAYSGSFAVVDFAGVHPAPMMPLSSARDFGFSDDVYIDKGNCFAFRVGAPARTSSKKMTFTTTAARDGHQIYIDRDVVIAGTGIDAASLMSFETLATKPSYTFTRPTFQPATRCYQVAGCADRFTKRSDAVAAAVRVAKDSAASPGRLMSFDVEVHEVLQRPTAAVRATLNNVKVTVLVTLASGPLKPAGWLLVAAAPE